MKFTRLKMTSDVILGFEPQEAHGTFELFVLQTHLDVILQVRLLQEIGGAVETFVVAKDVGLQFHLFLESLSTYITFEWHRHFRTIFCYNVRFFIGFQTKAWRLIAFAICRFYEVRCGTNEDPVLPF
jgi:hypothetical protein